MKNLTIAARLLEERTRLKLNQKDFASLGSVSKNTQISYEKGESYPDAAFLACAASAGVDVLYVITGKRSSETELNADESLLLTRLRQGSPVLHGYLRESGQQAPASAGITIGGDVGQQIGNAATFQAPVNFSVGKKR